jgi:hypothetical protein
MPCHLCKVLFCDCDRVPDCLVYRSGREVYNIVRKLKSETR